MKKNLLKWLSPVLAAAALAACGGGGGGGAVEPTTKEAVQTLLTAQDSLLATAVPATSAAILSTTDACYLNNGDTKASSAADFDADVTGAIASNTYRIGSKRTNLSVLAERSSTNPDGSARKEVDVQYDVVYTDGSTDFATKNTLISGSSAGSCATPQTGTALRFFGNRQSVGVFVRGRNIRNEQYVLATGAPDAIPVTYRREVQFGIYDPQGTATYVVVSGPGSATISGVATPFSVKMLSTRLLKSDPLLAGKTGNFTNWRGDDFFRFCRSTVSVVPASAADCATNGATGNGFGNTLQTSATGTVTATNLEAFDAGFNNIGFVAGGTYRFDVYNDDGWKTINGQAGKTPVFSYTTVLERLPYTHAEMLGGVVASADKFPKITAASLTPPQVASSLQSSTSTSFSVTWSAPTLLTDNRVFRLTEVGEFFQGPLTSNAVGIFNPAERYYVPAFPGSTAVAASALVISAKPATVSSKTYSELALYFTDRNDGRIISLVNFD